MSARRWLFVSAVLFAAGAVSIPAAATPAAATTARAGVVVHTDSKHRVVAPATLRPGLVHVRNSGARPVLIVSSTGHSVSSFVTAFNRASDTAGSVRFFRTFAVVDVLPAHADGFVRFTGGSYYLADNSVARTRTGLVRTVRVGGTRIDAAAPRATTIHTASSGAVTRSVTLRRGTFVKVVNSATSAHITSIQVIRRGVTAKQIRAAIADPKRHDPFRLTGSYFAPLGQLAGHTGTYRRVTAPAGRYFLFTASLTHPGLARGQVGTLTLR